MIDTHAHLDFPQYDSDREDVISTGFDSGVEAIINIGVDLETSRKSVELAEKYDKIYAAVGIHPHDSKDRPRNYLDQLKKLASRPKVTAIGEIGLDYYRDHSPRDIQRKIFKEQLDLARDLKLPVVVHIREAVEDSLNIIKDSGVTDGVLHSFPGSINDAVSAVSMGFYISFAGPITYPKSNGPQVARSLPLNKILSETDSPYLTPQAHRGKRNRPEYVKYVIEKLSQLFAPYTFSDIDRITARNAVRLFNLPIYPAPKFVYKIRNSVYINLTNRCSCHCYFCPRNSGDQGFVSGHNLNLIKEPTADEVIADIGRESDFEEVVFCGLGEPTYKLQELLEISQRLKKNGHYIRLDTNGHGSLINKVNLPQKLAGLINKVSVSFNAQDTDTYLKICKPDFGVEAYNSMIEFIKGCVKAGIQTDASVVELPEIDAKKCEKIISGLGARFRLRKYSKIE